MCVLLAEAQHRRLHSAFEKCFFTFVWEKCCNTFLQEEAKQEAAEAAAAAAGTGEHLRH